VCLGVLFICFFVFFLLLVIRGGFFFCRFGVVGLVVTLVVVWFLVRCCRIWGGFSFFFFFFEGLGLGVGFFFGGEWGVLFFILFSWGVGCYRVSGWVGFCLFGVRCGGRGVGLCSMLFTVFFWGGAGWGGGWCVW